MRVLTVAILVVGAAAPAIAQSDALSNINQTGAAQWEKIKPNLVNVFQTQIGNLAGTQYLNGKLKILQVWGTTVNLDAAPGFLNLTPFLARFRAPLNNSWSVSSWFKIKFKLIWFWVTMNVKVTVSNIKATVTAIINPLSDPERPKIVSVVPLVTFNIYLNTNVSFLNSLLNVFNGVYNNILKYPVLAFLNYKLFQQINPLVAGQPGTPHGLGGPALALTGIDPADLANKAQAMDNKLQNEMSPYGQTWSGIYSSPWENQGTVVGYGTTGDGAIWTGTYLIGESIRYKKTGSAQAADYAKKIVKGIDKLFKVCEADEETGVLARAAAPLNSPTGQQWLAQYLANGEPYHLNTIDGEVWIGRGRNFISRDQYIGIMTGLWAAYANLDDPEAKAIAKTWMTNVVTMLLNQNWLVFTPNDKISVSYFGVFPQQLWYAHLGKLLNPGNAFFENAFNSHKALADVCWFPTWLETFDQHRKYYKFNLQHTTYFGLMKVESDPVRWLKIYYGFKMLRKALKHHQNAWFNLAEMVNVPWSVNALKNETLEEIKRLGLRPRREILPDPDYNLTLESAILPAPISIDTGSLTSAATTGTATNDDDGPTAEFVAKYPVPPDKRTPTDFLWQRSPFGLGYKIVNGAVVWTAPLPAGGNYEEASGVDYILTYWLAKHLNILN